MAMTGVVFNRFPDIAAAFPEQLHKVVVQTTEIIQELAQNNAPVRSGFLKSSIYRVTSEGSTYGQADAPPTKSAYLLPEGPSVSDPYTGYVGVAASYGQYVEFGTRYMAAQPYFYPALEEGRSRFEEALNVFESFL